MPEIPSDERLTDEPATPPARGEGTIVSYDTDSGVVLCDRRNPQAWLLSDDERCLDEMR